MDFKIALMEQIHDDSLVCETEFETVGVANLKALRTMVSTVRGMCRRLRYIGGHGSQKFASQDNTNQYQYSNIGYVLACLFTAWLVCQ